MTRVRAGLGIVLLFVIVSDAQWLRLAAGISSRTPREDEVGRHEARIRPIKESLPSRGVIGYMPDPMATDLPVNFTCAVPPPDRLACVNHYKGFYLTRYTLAPLVLVHSTEPDLIVANFATNTVSTSIAPDLILVRDFGEGVMLFQRQRR